MGRAESDAQACMGRAIASGVAAVSSHCGPARRNGSERTSRVVGRFSPVKTVDPRRSPGIAAVSLALGDFFAGRGPFVSREGAANIDHVFKLPSCVPPHIPFVARSRLDQFPLARGRFRGCWLPGGSSLFRGGFLRCGSGRSFFGGHGVQRRELRSGSQVASRWPLECLQDENPVAWGGLARDHR